MNQSFSDIADQLFLEKLANPRSAIHNLQSRMPVHVVYGGANLFKADTINKLGEIALRSLETYAPNFVEFADAMWLPGADTLPKFADLIEDLEIRLADDPEKVKAENYHAWFAWTIYNRVIKKLQKEPIEDFRIDFEDGYGIRTDAEEDSHAISASDELAELMRRGDEGTERRSDGETEGRSDGATERRGNRRTKRRSDGGTTRVSFYSLSVTSSHRPTVVFRLHWVSRQIFPARNFPSCRSNFGTFSDQSFGKNQSSTARKFRRHLAENYKDGRGRGFMRASRRDRKTQYFTRKLDQDRNND